MLSSAGFGYFDFQSRAVWQLGSCPPQQVVAGQGLGNSGSVSRAASWHEQMLDLLGFMGLAQLSYSNKSQENLKSPYKWMAKG
jgi:hypothetical protein